jgi:hypothetical protein
VLDAVLFASLGARFEVLLHSSAERGRTMSREMKQFVVGTAVSTVITLVVALVILGLFCQ